MYFTYVVRPGDAPEGKGPQLKPFWAGIMDYNLRGGFAMQFLGYILLLVTSLIGGNIFQMYGVLAGNTDAIKDISMILGFSGAFLWTIGSIWIQNFRSIADDDASIRQSRGFRAGIKCLHQASLIDIVSSAMTTVLLFSFIRYFEDVRAAQEAGSGSTEVYASIARTLHAVALTLYGSSFFFIENFHGEGTAEFWGWVLAFSYCFSGLFEFMSLVLVSGIVYSVFNALFTLTLGVALMSSLLWACSFETVVNRSDVKLTQSAMRNEFYKSQNAIAYYGPPSGLDVA